MSTSIVNQDKEAIAERVIFFTQRRLAGSPRPIATGECIGSRSLRSSIWLNLSLEISMTKARSKPTSPPLSPKKQNTSFEVNAHIILNPSPTCRNSDFSLSILHCQKRDQSSSATVTAAQCDSRFALRTLQ